MLYIFYLNLDREKQIQMRNTSNTPECSLIMTLTCWLDLFFGFEIKLVTILIRSKVDFRN